MKDKDLRPYVQQGLWLKQQEGDLKWGWGRLLALLAPEGLALREAGARMQRWYDEVKPDEVDVSFEQCRSYRQVALRYPNCAEPGGQVYGEKHHRAARCVVHGVPWRHHFDVLHRLKGDDQWLVKAGEHGWSVNDMLDAAGKPNQGNQPPRTVSQKADAVLDHLQDRDVALEVGRRAATNHAAAQGLARAGVAHQRTSDDHVREAQRRRAPGLVNLDDLLAAEKLLGQANGDVKRAMDLLRRIDPFDQATRERVLVTARTLENTVGGLLDYVQTDMDDLAARLVGG